MSFKFHFIYFGKRHLYAQKQTQNYSNYMMIIMIIRELFLTRCSMLETAQQHTECLITSAITSNMPLTKATSGKWWKYFFGGGLVWYGGVGCCGILSTATIITHMLLLYRLLHFFFFPASTSSPARYSTATLHNPLHLYTFSVLLIYLSSPFSRAPCGRHLPL